ncbi:hypothetical protein ACQKP0_11860 [Heyndrickxia sp. NPDC080065]|uniref:hypothetical protein n=1 Tax=Heyndrickxia sp. NPDC080065 TaxID=3390568 RepID=UPI003D0492F7
MTDKNQENRIKILEMRVKKYQLDMSRSQKKNEEYLNLFQSLEKLLEEKVDEIVKMGEQNHLTMQLYRNEVKQIKNQMKTIQTSLLNMENEMMGLRDDLINKIDANIGKNEINNEQEYFNELSELKQKLTDISNLIKSDPIDIVNNSNVKTNPHLGENKSSFTFRDLQNASKINSTSSMNNQSMFKLNSSFRQTVRNPQIVRPIQNNTSEEISKSTAIVNNDKDEEVDKKLPIEDTTELMKKEKKVTTAFSFFKSRK